MSLLEIAVRAFALGIIVTILWFIFSEIWYRLVTVKRREAKYERVSDQLVNSLRQDARDARVMQVAEELRNEFR